MSSLRARIAITWLAVGNWPCAPQLTARSLSRSAMSCTTTKRQGSKPKELGDSRPVSRMRRKSSSGILRAGSKVLQAWRKAKARRMSCLSIMSWVGGCEMGTMIGETEVSVGCRSGARQRHLIYIGLKPRIKRDHAYVAMNVQRAILHLVRDSLCTKRSGHAAAWRSGVLALALLPAAPCFAAHPLITEDTATQGRGNGQLELTLEYGHDEATDAEQDAADLAAVLSCGVPDTLDLLLTVPYSRADTAADGAATTVHGLGDVGLDAKWRFFEAGGLSVALKAGATYPSGDETQGLGTGKSTFGVNLVAAYETAQWGGYLHVAHFRNRNVLDEREAIRHASFALTHTLTDRLKLVADLGRFTSTDRAVSEDARFLTLGAIYGIPGDLDVAFGVKKGLSDPETDTTLLLGTALRF